jgi:hypothetical protein
MLLKIPATRTPRGALIFVALMVKILSCNKKKKYSMVYDQNYFNCSTLGLIEKLHQLRRQVLHVAWVTFVYFCLLLFTFVYFCLLLCTFVYFCLLLFTFVYFCLLLFTFVYFCLLLFTFVNFCLLLFTFVYFCLHLLRERFEPWSHNGNFPNF